jgi:hypothetical protein
VSYVPPGPHPGPPPAVPRRGHTLEIVLGAVIGAVALPVLTFAGIAVISPGGLVVGPLAILGGACVAILASLNAADG